jgi:hypothetical protein
MFKVLATFSLILLLASCSENIVSDCGCDADTNSTVVMRATFSDIQSKLFNKTCATSGCHADFQSPILKEGVAYANLVGVDNIFGTMQLVKPGDSQNSYLMKKLLGVETTRMPSGGERLDQAIIDSVAAWIDNGALNN